MKFNVLQIIRDHWATLRPATSNSTHYGDLIVFYGTPIAAGAVAYVLKFNFRPETYNVSITFFGIFVALLLNIQVAIFGIFLRKWDLPPDDRQAHIQNEHLELRRTLLSELNTNISYLTVVCSAALITFLVFYIVELSKGLGPAMATVIYCHFMLTFLMIVKRAYALFQNEYSKPL